MDSDDDCIDLTQEDVIVSQTPPSEKKRKGSKWARVEEPTEEGGGEEGRPAAAAPKRRKSGGGLTAEERAAAKAEVRAAKAAAKAASASIKSRSKLEAAQAGGRYALREIAIHMTEDLHREEVGAAIREAAREFAIGSSEDRKNAWPPPRPLLRVLPATGAGAGAGAGQAAGGDGSLLRCVRWRRARMLPGTSKEPAFAEHPPVLAEEPFALLIYPGTAWLDVLERGARAAGGVVGEVKRLCRSLPPPTRRSVLVTGLEDALRRRPAFLRERVEAAHASLYVLGEVDVRAVERLGDAANEVLRMTRVIAKTPYDRAPTALACVSREKGAGAGETGGSNRSWRATWSAMLQQVNGMSAQKAGWVVDAFPTFASLMDAYKQGSGDGEGSEEEEEKGEADKEGLLTEVMVRAQEREGAEGSKARRFTKLSREVYRFFTTVDDKLIIGHGSE